MGDLQAHRVNPPKRAFEAPGVDYTGAIGIKSSRFRRHTCYKAYIAVFICLASKAIQEPIAQNTQLGWIVFGPAEAAQTTSISIGCNLANLNNMVLRFFELDQVSTTRQLSALEKWCEDYF